MEMVREFGFYVCEWLESWSGFLFVQRDGNGTSGVALV